MHFWKFKKIRKKHKFHYSLAFCLFVCLLRNEGLEEPFTFTTSLRDLWEYIYH